MQQPTDSAPTTQGLQVLVSECSLEEMRHKTSENGGPNYNHEAGGGGCPYFLGVASSATKRKEDNSDPLKLDYTSYLNVERLLSCQRPIESGKATHEQMLFIITHQVYELWFKQVIFEIDSIREMFMHEYLNESKMLVLNNRLQRVVLIFKTMVEQFCILETMTSLDFMDFRPHLESASGFQSLQFRLIEIKLGIRDKSRVMYNKMPYQSAFEGKSGEAQLNKALSEPSLLDLVEKWLERTPGLSDGDMNLWEFYAKGVEKYLDDFYRKPAETETDPALKTLKEENYKKQKETFETILEPAKYNYFVEQHERTLSHKAFQGAMMISIYREVPRFSPAFQTLTLLVDIDALLIRWRLNHLMMVQRMIGNKMGTGGSSGYQYLRSTVSDRYKPFLDLTNLTTYLIPREYVSPLSGQMQRRLSTVNLWLAMESNCHQESDE